MKKKIFIIWASWNVWRELVRQVIEKDSECSKIIWIADSSWYIFESKWIDLNLLTNFCISREESLNIINDFWKKLHKLSDLVDLVSKKWLDWKVVFVDVTAWKDELLKFHKKVLLDSSNYLSTANKNPISLYSMKEFNELNSLNSRYDTNTTVMWWAWVLNFINFRSNFIDDKIMWVEWIFSWTLWFIMSELDKRELKFSEIVKLAKEQWYTEPNPWDDLNWLDVARKVVILARYAWYSVDMSDVSVKPLIDEKYSKFSWIEFLEELKNEDDFFDNFLNEAISEWNVLRYIWEISFDKNWKISMKVWLKKVPKNSDFWTANWTLNVAVIETEIMANPMPHSLKSRWAGLLVTAWSLREWISKFNIN